jgi:hypothetical protein
MLHKLKLRAESFDNWVLTVKNALDLNASKKLGKNIFHCNICKFLESIEYSHN